MRKRASSVVLELMQERPPQPRAIVVDLTLEEDDVMGAGQGVPESTESPGSTDTGLGAVTESPESTDTGLGAAAESPESTDTGLGAAAESPESTDTGLGAVAESPESTDTGLGAAAESPESTDTGLVAATDTAAGGGAAVMEAGGVAACAGLRFDGVSLLGHQVDHAARVLGALQRYGVSFDTSDTGTGKTYVACKVAERLGCGQVVVICPNIVEKKWKTILSGANQPDRWLVFPYSLMTRTAKTHGYFTFYPQTRKEIVINGNGKFVCRDDDSDGVSLKRGTKLAALISLPGTLLILDETHKVKNAATQISRAVLELIGRVRERDGWVLHVSATPFDQLFQLPQYLRFMGTEPERARQLVKLATTQGGAGGSGAGEAALWDPIQCVRDIMSAATGKSRYYKVEDALRALGASGSDVGSKWKAVRAFMYRMAGMLPVHPMTSYQVSTQMEQPPTAKKGGKQQQYTHRTRHTPCIDGHVANALTQFLRENGPEHEQFFSVHGDAVALDAILWPVAIEDMDADIALARDLIWEVLPRVRFRMVMPDLGFARHDMDLFLEDVDVSETVAALTYLPDYEALNVAPCPAPLISPDGKHFVPESAALGWRSGGWQLGGPEPVACWERIAAEARASGRDHRSAEAMALMCRAAAASRGRGGEAAGGAAAGSGWSVELESNPRIRLEGLKVPSLFKVVRRVLADDAGSKAVVMFNYLSPLKEFVRLCVAGQCGSLIEISGAMPPGRRADAVDLFNSSPEHRLLVCTIQVMNEGIDLHDTKGGEHRYSFMMACPSAIMTQQAKGRIFRAGVRSHAINCVVFGGYALGGELEEKLVMRIGTKNATLQTVAPAVRMTSVAEFRAACGRIHAGDTQPSAAAVAVSAAAPAALPVLFPDSWRRLEFAARCWPELKSAQSAAVGGGSGDSAAWRREFLAFGCTDSAESMDRTRLSELQMRAVRLVPFDYEADASLPVLTCGSVWPIDADPQSTLTYERALRWAAVVSLR